MSSEQNIAIFRSVVEEGFNKVNLDALDDLFAPDYVENQYQLHTTLEGLKKDIRFLHKAFPDFHLTIEDVIADEDKVWGRMTGVGTNLGGLAGAPNGKSFSITVFDVLRFKDAKIVEHWGVPDRFAQLSQLGLLPQPQSA